MNLKGLVAYRLCLLLLGAMRIQARYHPRQGFSLRAFCNENSSAQPKLLPFDQKTAGVAFFKFPNEIASPQQKAKIRVLI